MKTSIFRIFYWSDGYESDTVGFFVGGQKELKQRLKVDYGLQWECEVGIQETDAELIDEEISKMQDEIYRLENLIEEAQIAKAKFEDS